MLIGSALQDLGIAPFGGAEPVVVHFKRGEKAPKNYLFSQTAETEIDRFANLYVSTGTYRADTITELKGRDTANVVAVRMIPFDSDLSDFTGFSKDYIYSLPDDEIGLLVDDLHSTLIDALKDHGVSPHVTMFSGHGIHSLVFIRDAKPEDTVPLQDASKAFIRRVNEAVGFKLIDPQRSDPGPGLVRIPGSLNTKNPERKRRVSTIFHNKILPSLSAQRFIGLSGDTERVERTRPVISEQKLTDDAFADIVNAITPYWQSGSRHHLALGLCGLLAKAGVPIEQAADVITEASAGDDEAWDRLRTVRTTYDRIASGQQVSGYRMLRDLIGVDTMDYLDRVLDSVKPRPILIAGGKRTTEQPEPVIYEPMPEAAFYGWFREYRDLMGPTTEASDSYHLAASLTLAGALMGRRVWTEHAGKRLYGNLFTLLVGTAGKSRKDTAMDRAAEMPNYDTMSGSNLHTAPFEVRSGYGSGEKLVADLAESPNIFWKETEATSIFANMKREATRSLRDRLIEAWDTRDFMRNAVKKDAAIATNPYLSLITATQPTRLNTSVTTDDIISGLMSRMIVVPGSPKPKKASPPKPDDATARELYQRIRDAIGQYGSSADQIPAHLQFDPAAQAMIDTWYLTSPDHDDEDLQSITVRYELHIRKIALIFAVSDAATAIRVDHLAAAMEFVEWEGRAVRQMLPEWGAEKETRIEQRILAILKHGPMERRKVQMNCKGKWTAREFGYVFEAMVKNGTIESTVDGKAVVYQIAA